MPLTLSFTSTLPVAGQGQEDRVADSIAGSDPSREVHVSGVVAGT